MPGVSLSVGSQRNLSNNFIVDGLSANDDAAALSGITYGVDAVEQFQVVTSGGQAELGRALGGYVNVVTKSGTNVLHGDVYDYVRDDRFNATNALSGTKLPMSQSQYGASLGGPIVREPDVLLRERRTAPARSVRPGHDLAGQRRRRSTRGWRPSATRGRWSPRACIPNPVDSTNVLAKVDHQVSGRDQFGVRYSLYDVSSENSRGAGGLNAPSASSGLDNIDQTIAVSNTLTLSARTVLETRAQFAYGDLKAPPTDPIGPAVSIAGVASFGTQLGQPDAARRTRMYQVVNNLSHQAGAHAFRVGRRLPLQRRRDHLPAIGSRQLHVLVARELPGRRLQQRRLHPDVRRRPRSRRPIRTSASTRRTSGRSARASR